MSMHASCQHTHVRTCRNYSDTLELRWWRVWRWFVLAPHTIIHTNMHTCVYACVCVCVCVCVFFLCLFFWVYLTAVCLTLCFSLTQVSFFVLQPVVGPAGRHFCRSYIASVSVCFSWVSTEYCAWVKVLNVCECVYVWVYMTGVWPNIKCLLHMDRASGLYAQASGRTDVHAQTDRQTDAVVGLAK